MFTIYSLYVHCIFTKCPRYVHYIFTTYSLYVHYMFTNEEITIYSLYVHYMLTNEEKIEIRHLSMRNLWYLFSRKEGVDFELFNPITRCFLCS